MLDTFHNILDIVNTCENLSANFVKDGKIENASDYLMDAQILKMSHDLMGSTVEKMGNSDFCEEEFIAALTNVLTFDTGEHNFGRLLEVSTRCCKTSHFCVPIAGTFDFDAGPRPLKLRKERQHAKVQYEEARAPENVRQLTKSDRGAEKINIVRTEIQRVCLQRKADCVPYFELICDPENFMKSVDIAFQISFLVRDGFLGLKKIEDEPHVYLINPDSMSQQSQCEHTSGTVQCIMSLNTSLWKEKIQKYRILSPLLNIDSQNNMNE